MAGIRGWLVMGRPPRLNPADNRLPAIRPGTHASGKPGQDSKPGLVRETTYPPVLWRVRISSITLR